MCASYQIHGTCYYGYKSQSFFAGHDPTRESGQEVLRISWVESRVRKCSKTRGSGQVGSGSVQNLSRAGSRAFQVRGRWGQECFKSHGSSRVNNFSDFTGRVRSAPEVMKSSRVGSGNDPRETGHSRVGSV